MTRFVMVTSGKGGVGKTTVSINLGVALRNIGKDVIVLDGNLTTPNVGLYLGVNKVPVSLHDVIKEEKNILDAMYAHDSGIKVIPGSISIDSIGSLDSKRIKKSIEGLKGASEIVVIDSPGGLNKDCLSLLSLVDEVLIVTTPDLVSVTDSLKTIKIAEEKNITVLGVVVNKVKNDKHELSTDSIETMLNKPVLASIPESDDVRKAHSLRHPVVYAAPKSDVSKRFNLMAEALSGRDTKSLNIESGLLNELFRKLH